MIDMHEYKRRAAAEILAWTRDLAPPIVIVFLETAVFVGFVALLLVVWACL